MAVGAKKKPEMPRYLPENNKTGDFNPHRTLSGSFFIISERLESTRAGVLAFTANKQANAGSTRARRFSDDSSGLLHSEQKSQRKSTRKVTQEADDGKKKCAGSKRVRRVPVAVKIEDGVGDRIGEEVVEGIDGGADEKVK